MAILTTEQSCFLGAKFQKVTRVLKDGTFRIKYPEKVAAVTDEIEAVGDTLKEAEDIFKSLCKRVKDAATSERKVILYKIKGSSSLCFGISFSVAASVAIEYETDLGEDGMRYEYKRVPDEDDLPWKIRSFDALCPGWSKQSEDVLDWTPARHLFFTKMAIALQEMKTKLVELGEDQEKLLDYADTGRLFDQ